MTSFSAILWVTDTHLDMCNCLKFHMQKYTPIIVQLHCAKVNPTPTHLQINIIIAPIVEEEETWFIHAVIPLKHVRNQMIYNDT